MVTTRRPSGRVVASGQPSYQKENSREVNQAHASCEKNQIHVTNQPAQHATQQDSCLVTHQDLDNVVNQINENLQRTIRAMTLSLQNEGEGTSRPHPTRSPPEEAPHHPPSPACQSRRADDDQPPHSPRGRRLYPWEEGYIQQSHIMAQGGRRVPATLRAPGVQSQGDARNVINQMLMQRGALDARDIINQRRENDARTIISDRRREREAHQYHESSRHRDTSAFREEVDESVTSRRRDTVPPRGEPIPHQLPQQQL